MPKALMSRPRGARRSLVLSLAPGRRRRVIGVAILPDRALLRQALPEDRDAGHVVALVEAHHDHAAGTGALPADAVHVGAHDLPGGADEEQFVGLLADQRDGSHVAGLGT